MRLNPLYQLTLLKLRGLTREPEAIFWVFVFPLLMALALGIAKRVPVFVEDHVIDQATPQHPPHYPGEPLGDHDP